MRKDPDYRPGINSSLSDHLLDPNAINIGTLPWQMADSFRTSSHSSDPSLSIRWAIRYVTDANDLAGHLGSLPCLRVFYSTKWKRILSMDHRDTEWWTGRDSPYNKVLVITYCKTDWLLNITMCRETMLVLWPVIASIYYTISLEAVMLECSIALFWLFHISPTFDQSGTSHAWMLYNFILVIPYFSNFRALSAVQTMYMHFHNPISSSSSFCHDKAPVKVYIA